MPRREITARADSQRGPLLDGPRFEFGYRLNRDGGGWTTEPLLSPIAVARLEQAIFYAWRAVLATDREAAAFVARHPFMNVWGQIQADPPDFVAKATADFESFLRYLTQPNSGNQSELAHVLQLEGLLSANDLIHQTRADSPAGTGGHLLASDSVSQGESTMSSQSNASYPDARSAFAALDELDQEISTAQVPFHQRLQSILNRLAGKSFESFAENQVLADKVRDLLFRLGMRIACPQKRCGQPALIRCNPVPSTRFGSFEFQHPINGVRKTHAASTVLPQLSLVPAQPDRRRRPPARQRKRGKKA